MRWCHHYLVFASTLASLLAAPQQGTDFSVINPDGSFSFGLKTDDVGGFYHEATGSPKSTVRGRFGSRNAETGRIEETSYTAGRRGFRARGPSIHRRMDLSQIPRGPIGTPEDPYADPFEDPSYGFGFKSPTYSRREDQDRFARLNGQYTYLDDVGERHLVRYMGSAQNGFDVTNSFPDAPNYVHYSRSLYRDANPQARGRMSMQRKNNSGQYAFIAAGPDQRRSESVGPDGITRGSYSYLDDKGVQRTVQYIAGAGIGYRIVQTVTGSGTHNLPRPTVPEHGVYTQQSNDLPPESLYFDDTPNVAGGRAAGDEKGSGVGGGEGDFGRDVTSDDERSNGGKSLGTPRTPSFEYDENEIRIPYKPRTTAQPSTRRPPVNSRRPYRPEYESKSDPNAIVPENVQRRPVTPTPPTPPQTRGGFGGYGSGRGYNRSPNVDLRPTAPAPVSGTPTPTPYPDYFSVNSLDFDKANIRAHVQNIDLLPISPRYPSPGDALKWDIITGN